MFDLIKKPEILAPAGSMDALKAAVYNGADAVYLGGIHFGARAFADNFDENELIQAIYYAHLYGVKVYLTVNTLFRNDEIKELYSYIKPYYEAGLDAVIVQDLGVMQYIHSYFPDMPIHASTQMSITTPYSFELLKDYGVTRIVPARELSIDEIEELKKTVNGKSSGVPELEVFVQGALCICYSGHCLMSSFIGGRSGNRGRCAQSCRLSYSLHDNDGRIINIDGSHILSPKDLCGLEVVPELISAGVDSFKIEGRMKKPEYVAACTKSYRKCVDYIFDNIDSEITISTLLADNNIFKSKYKKIVEECKDEMASVFNRGGFTQGYYHKKNGRDMMSMTNPGHMGIIIGKIIDINKNKISVKLNKSVNKGDIFVIKEVIPEITLTNNINDEIGSVIELNVPRAKELRRGMNIVRMLDYSLDKELSKYKDEKRKIPVIGKVILKEGQTAKLQIVLDTIKVECEGAIVEKADTRPVDKKSVEEKLKQTGETLYEFKDLSIEMDDNIFYPMKALKQLRRDGFSSIETAVKNLYKRECVLDNGNRLINKINVDSNKVNNKVDNSLLHIVVSSKEQLYVIYNYYDQLDNIEVSLDLQFFCKKDIMEIIDKHSNIGLILPMIFRKKAIDEVRGLSLNDFKSITVRNIDELAFLKYMNYRGTVVIDYSLYVMNDIASFFIRNLFTNAIITLPVELNKIQLENLDYIKTNSELIIYNYQPLMVTAQCFKENSSCCNHSDNNSFILKDNTNHSFFVKTICKYCYNIVLNGLPTILFDQLLNEEKSYANYRKRVQFSIEDKSKTIELMEYLSEHDIYKQHLSDKFDNYTRGHFKRGVT